ncbi:vasodilator-stimulated phosphoprotein-like [Penaeus indicus]|uniref:vasodilator-stimulated phosphoprotein-like n=1 Tax=Penaeus indicus TaxID=29960 RepID=UPI00300C6884
MKSSISLSIPNAWNPRNSIPSRQQQEKLHQHLQLQLSNTRIPSNISTTPTPPPPHPTTAASPPPHSSISTTTSPAAASPPTRPRSASATGTGASQIMPRHKDAHNLYNHVPHKKIKLALELN